MERPTAMLSSADATRIDTDGATAVGEAGVFIIEFLERDARLAVRARPVYSTGQDRFMHFRIVDFFFGRDGR
jgi:hypothetical protein